MYLWVLSHPQNKPFTPWNKLSASQTSLLILWKNLLICVAKVHLRKCSERWRHIQQMYSTLLLIALLCNMQKIWQKKRTQPRDSFSLREGRGEGGGGGMQMCANGISAPARFWGFSVKHKSCNYAPYVAVEAIMPWWFLGFWEARRDPSMPPPPCMRQHICIQCRSRVAIQLWVGTHSLGQVPYLVILSGPGAIFGYTLWAKCHIWLYSWSKPWPYMYHQGNYREELATFDPPARLPLKGLLCHIAEVWEHYR